MKTLLTLGKEFNHRHFWLLKTAKECGVALCGGCAAAVTKGKTDYVPADLDFAAKRADALGFVAAINSFMLERSAHYRIFVNSQNKFVPSAATAHFRITGPFWLPICLFVLPDEDFKCYRIKGGHFLQIYSQIKAAADELTQIDHKPRLTAENDQDDEPHPLLQPAVYDEPDTIPINLHSFGDSDAKPIGSVTA